MINTVQGFKQGKIKAAEKGGKQGRIHGIALGIDQVVHRIWGLPLIFQRYYSTLDLMPSSNTGARETGLRGAKIPTVTPDPDNAGGGIFCIFSRPLLVDVFFCLHCYLATIRS
jgi:hypothetical protein